MVFDCLSLPPSIEDMDYQRRACSRREKGTARVEVETAPNHNEKEKKQANDQRALFDLHEHDDPPTRAETRDCLTRSFPFSLSQLTPPSSHRRQLFEGLNRWRSAGQRDGACANIAREYSQCNSHLLSRREPAAGTSQESR